MTPDGDEPRISFFTITDDRFAPGTTALVNSLRLVGHDHPVTILDCGLRPDQRRRLKAHASLVPWDRTQATNPTLFKPYPHLTSPRGVVVIIDSDIIVTGRLDPIVERARDGAICVVPDPEHDRWFAEWASVFGLREPLRREAYVNAGFVVLSADRHPGFLERWWELCRSIWHAPTIYEAGGDNPTAQADQDALNALLMSEVDPGSVHRLDPAVAPATGRLSEGVRVVDPATLACSFRGGSPVLLHSSGRAKPWFSGDWPFLRPTAYTTLLRRTLTWPDVAVVPIRSDLPPWLRPGAAGAAWMRVVSGAVGLAWRLGEGPVLRPAARIVLRVLQRGVGRWRAAQPPATDAEARPDAADAT